MKSKSNTSHPIHDSQPMTLAEYFAMKFAAIDWDKVYRIACFICCLCMTGLIALATIANLMNDPFGGIQSLGWLAASLFYTVMVTLTESKALMWLFIAGNCGLLQLI